MGPISLFFFGTGAMRPSLLRGCSSIGISRSTGNSVQTWLFDCGDGSFRQILKMNELLMKRRADCLDQNIKPSDVLFTNQEDSSNLLENQPLPNYQWSHLNRVFITHLHGDHIFGLPSVLLSSFSARSTSDVIHLYGPPGLGYFVKTVFFCCKMKAPIKCIVHEFVKSDSTSFQSDSANRSSNVSIEPILEYKPNEWICFEDEHGIMKAGVLAHDVQCHGYVYQENSSTGSVKMSAVMPHLERNKQAFEEMNIPVWEAVRALKNGKNVVLPDGFLLDPHNREFIHEFRPSRKISILGDTFDAGLMKDLCMDSDILVHESTHCSISCLDSKEMTSKASSKMFHSTENDAANFAREVRAKNLILNHLSPRYESLEREFQMIFERDMIESASRAFQSSKIRMAADFSTFTLPGIRREMDMESLPY